MALCHKTLGEANKSVAIGEAKVSFDELDRKRHCLCTGRPGARFEDRPLGRGVGGGEPGGGALWGPAPGPGSHAFVLCCSLVDLCLSLLPVPLGSSRTLGQWAADGLRQSGFPEVSAGLTGAESIPIIFSSHLAQGRRAQCQTRKINKHIS